MRTYLRLIVYLNKATANITLYVLMLAQSLEHHLKSGVVAIVCHRHYQKPTSLPPTSEHPCLNGETLSKGVCIPVNLQPVNPKQGVLSPVSIIHETKINCPQNITIHRKGKARKPCMRNSSSICFHIQAKRLRSCPLAFQWMLHQQNPNLDLLILNLPLNT